MKKEKVFIVLTHKHSLKAGTKDDWEVTEKVEFINAIRDRHYNYASAIGDYINKSMLVGKRIGMGEYDNFERYVRKKYAKQMDALDQAYNSDQVAEQEESVVSDKVA